MIKWTVYGNDLELYDDEKDQTLRLYFMAYSALVKIRNWLSWRMNDPDKWIAEKLAFVVDYHAREAFAAKVEWSDPNAGGEGMGDQ